MPRPIFISIFTFRILFQKIGKKTPCFKKYFKDNKNFEKNFFYRIGNLYNNPNCNDDKCDAIVA